MNVAIKKSNGWLGLITNPSAHTGGMKSIAEAISRPAGLLENASLLVHESGLRIGHHHVPGKKLGRSRPKLANNGEGKIDVGTFPAFGSGTAQAVGLLAPHKWNFHATRRSEERSGAQNVNIVAVFEGSNETKLALVRAVSASRPMMGHVNQTHTFQGKKFPVTRGRKLAISDSTNSARFTNEGAPFGNARKAEPSAVLATTDKGGAHRKTLGMVSTTTRTGLSAVDKGKAGIGKVTAENTVVIRETEAATHTPMPPVPGATASWWEGQRVPTCPW